MKTLSQEKFESLFDNAVVERFCSAEYTFINYDEDEFYFYYDAENKTFNDSGEYKLNENQLEKIAEKIDEHYVEDKEEIDELSSIRKYFEYSVHLNREQ